MRAPRGTLQRNEGVVGGLHHEALALRLVAVTMRAALEDLDHAPRSARSEGWARLLAAWIDGVLEYHRGRIRLLRNPVDIPSEESGVLAVQAELDRALTEAEAAAHEAHRAADRSSSESPIPARKATSDRLPGDWRAAARMGPVRRPGQTH